MFRRDCVWIGALAALLSACGPGAIEEGARLDDPANPGADDPSGAGPNTPTVPNEPFPQDDPTCPSAAAVVSASNGWQSVPASQAAFDTLEFTVMARPEVTNLDAMVAVGSQDIADFSDTAIAVRPTNGIEA